MRTLLLIGWLIVPVVVGAYHYGPGQDQLVLDDAAQVLAEADRAAAAEQWQAASDGYEKAQALLPPGRTAEVRRVRLERAKARMYLRQLPEASAELKGLVEEIQAEKEADPALLDEARGALAGAEYYMTWLMRLEGLGREEWEPEIEGARQTYRLLAEQAERKGDARAADRWRQDLEGAIRLARMEPGELQARAIPKQCQGCKSGQCKKPGRSKAKGDKKDARGASSGPPPDDSGS
jgi:hypothetical protein